MYVLTLLIFFDGIWHYLAIWHFFGPQRYPVESSWFVDVGAQSDDSFMHVQQLLLVEKFSLLNGIFGRLVIR